MACIVIGDIHGRAIWKTVVAKHPHDTIIFIGDYFDSKDGHTAQEQIDNFQQILALKSGRAEKTILLTGNHDFHYLPFSGETYGGFQELKAIDISEAITPAYKGGLLQICYRHGDYLISHAGLTKKWCRNFDVPLNDPLAAIEKMWQERPINFRFHPGAKWEPTGDEPEQGPLWVRPNSLKKNKLAGFWQIVGHTQQPFINIGNKLIMVDCFSNAAQYLEISEAGIPFVHPIV
jgi:hypothetical protein